MICIIILATLNVIFHNLIKFLVRFSAFWIVLIVWALDLDLCHCLRGTLFISFAFIDGEEGVKKLG